ncbi:hypothetical protein KV697_19150 [Sphingomonas sanguinis]|uniref:hypothetical protein n=1 Tax=Sphingomonas sanguinis TaxID=33051 RepID=UPI001C59B1ED|nr:hypothetical protein [Sphingomonas sanguinis]QXT35769.1 hypothetical protein KV697_19150 [Sphingomonas sanguinis]
MAGGQMQDAAPLGCDHHRYGGQGCRQGARENQNTHHDHHDVSLLPYCTIRHINPTVTVDFFIQFRRRIGDIRINRAKSATLRKRYATVNLCSLL